MPGPITPRASSTPRASLQVHTPLQPENMLERIKGLTDIGAMTRLLHETIAHEREIDTELDVLLGQRQELERKLSSLHKAAEVLELVRADSDQMHASVRGTCILAEHVSGKVRELDLAQSRVQDAIGRINAIVDRTSCIEGVKTAMEAEDYEAAAKYVETFLQLDRQYQDAAAGPAETASEQRDQLLQSKNKLEEVIRRRFAAAAESRDHAQAVRLAKLFPPIGLQEDGLKAYVGYLRKLVAKRAREDYEALVESLDSRGSSSADFVGTLTDLLKDIAVAVDENEELLRGSFGEEAVPHAVKELQEECELRGTQILRRYIEQRKLVRMSKDVGTLSRGGPGVPAAEGTDPREVEIYLEEMLLLSQRSEEYLQYMISKMREAEAAGAQVDTRDADLLKQGQFNRTVAELMGYYMVLEEYFMVENCNKAIKIDEAVEDAMTSSMVDDVFYILQSCTKRAISTGSIQCVCYVLNCVNNLLGNEVKEALQRKVREPNLAAKLFAATGVVAKSGSEVATALNNADVSAEYVQKLKHELEEFCLEVFTAPVEREKVKSVLNELGEISGVFKQTCNAGLEQLCNSITPRFRGMLDAVASISYELTESQYAENEANDPWVQKLLLAIETNVTWLQPLFTTNNYDSLVHLVIDFVVKRLEVIMTQKRFNQLGGLQLDRDARTLVGHFSGMTQRTVRDKFARLSQMATILNLEKVGEILDYWGENSGPMTWRLTPAEVRRVLALRVDFRPEAIASLKL